MIFKKEIKDKLKFSNTPVKKYEVRPFEQLHGQLVYANASKLFSNESFSIYARQYKSYTCKIFLINECTNFSLSNTSNDFIKENFINNEFNLSLLDNEKQVSVYILNKNSSNALDIVRDLSTSLTTKHHIGLLFNHDDLVLEEFASIPIDKQARNLYLDILFVILACKDPDEMSD